MSLHHLHNEGFLLGCDPAADHSLAGGGQFHKRFFNEFSVVLAGVRSPKGQVLQKAFLLLLLCFLVLLRVKDFLLGRDEAQTYNPGV